MHPINRGAEAVLPKQNIKLILTANNEPFFSAVAIANGCQTPL
ncbi:MAG: hypothetical protein ACI8W9_001021 [Psychromonas sp.]|jgi:hypothetical protein